MNSEKPWKIKGTHSWKMLRRAKNLINRPPGVLITKYEIGKSIKK